MQAKIDAGEIDEAKVNWSLVHHLQQEVEEGRITEEKAKAMLYDLHSGQMGKLVKRGLVAMAGVALLVVGTLYACRREPQPVAAVTRVGDVTVKGVPFGDGGTILIGSALCGSLPEESLTTNFSRCTQAESERRRNIPLRQQIGATALEAMKLAGHASVDRTLLYTLTDAERERQADAIFDGLMNGGTNQ